MAANHFLADSSALQDSELSGQIGVKKQLVKSASFNSKIPVLLTRKRQTKHTKIPHCHVSTDLIGSNGETPTISSGSISSASEGSPEFYTPMSHMSWMDPSAIPTLKLPSIPSTPNIENIIKGFPSTKTQCQFVDWENLKNAKVASMDEQMERAFQAARLLDHIRQIFNTNGEMLENSSISKQNSSKEKELKEASTYLRNHFKNEIRKEDRYSSILKQIDLSPTIEALRKKRIGWIFEAGYLFEYHLDTLYTAIFCMDSFLHKFRFLDEETSSLLAVASFHMAAKMEEVAPISLNGILNEFEFLKAKKSKDVARFEGVILSALRFEISPPSPYIMTDVVIQSTFPGLEDLYMKTCVQELTQELILVSLKDIKYYHVKPSTKARLALEVAVEYVIYHWNIFKQMDDAIVYEPYSDYHKVRQAGVYCEMIYRDLLCKEVNH